MSSVVGEGCCCNELLLPRLFFLFPPAISYIVYNCYIIIPNIVIYRNYFIYYSVKKTYLSFFSLIRVTVLLLLLLR